MHHHARGLEATRDTAWALDGAGRAAARPPQRAREHDLPAVPLAARGRAGPHLRAGPGSLPRGRPSRLPYGRRGQGLRRHAAGGHPPRRPPGAEGLRHARRRPGRSPRLRARGDAPGRRPRGRAPRDAAARPRVGAGADVRGQPHARRARARGARRGVAGGRGAMRRALALGAVLASLYTTAGCSDRASGTQRAVAPPAVPILAAEAVRKDVPLDVGVIGTVQALTTVGVKAEVAGQVVQVHLKEGQDVKAGQLLFTIDPRPFEATVAQAEANVGRDTAQLRQAEAALAQRQAEVQQALANLERDQAQLENARVQERRYKTLVEKELVARELYDQFRTNLSALGATVNADRAAIENARAAALAAQAGVENARAVIRADEAMVQTARLNLGYTTIRAPKPTTGRLTFVNNTVDPSTATIQLKGTFDNAENTLWPGQYVEVVLTLTTETAVVVPSQAIQPGQQGPYVFVVKPDLTVQPRPVELGRRLATETIVTRGVAPGERVVTDGQLRLVPGSRVEIKPPQAS